MKDQNKNSVGEDNNQNPDDSTTNNNNDENDLNNNNNAGGDGVASATLNIAEDTPSAIRPIDRNFAAITIAPNPITDDYPYGSAFISPWHDRIHANNHRFINLTTGFGHTANAS